MKIGTRVSTQKGVGIVVYVWTNGALEIQMFEPVRNDSGTYGRIGYCMTITADEVLASYEPEETYTLYRYGSELSPLMYSNDTSKMTLLSDELIYMPMQAFYESTSISANIVYTGVSDERFTRNKLYKVASGELMDNTGKRHYIEELNDLDNLMGYMDWIELVK